MPLNKDVLTPLEMFEVRRYPTVSLGELSKLWQWFIHRGWLTLGEMDLLLV